MALRGFHSNNNSSTPIKTEESGAANVADIPAHAPATSNVRRSTLVRRKNWPIIDPNAPPVMMMGPSAPNGPPVPMEIAADSGLSMASRGWTRLPFIKMDSIASGIPCPRIRSDPYRAISPTMSDPTTGTAIAYTPSWFPAGEANEVSNRW
jgi:hypothetical protein